MDYSIYKDSDVISTVDRIKKILSGVGIDLKEYIQEYSSEEKYIPYSMRVTLFGKDNYGTNGKGTCLENCIASAYSEFMERLQNFYLRDNCLKLVSDDFIYTPDEKEYLPENNQILNKYYDDEIIEYANKIVDFLKDNKKQTEVPFYSVKENKVVYLPIDIIKFFQGSNGMSAGNTVEEALVQGLSEVFERNAMRQIIFNELSMPDIPKNIYEKYNNLSGIIKYISKQGWTITVKDASVGKKFPVVCTILENKEKKLLTFKFGAHPSLPIAIERTLTEFTQGNFLNESTYDLLMFNSYGVTNDFLYKNYLFIQSFRFSQYLPDTNKLFSKILNSAKNYDFSLNSWIDENKKYSNKDLLKFLFNTLKVNSIEDVYIRDVSFLNFPSFYIYIPALSEIHNYDKNTMERDFDEVCWDNYKADKVENHKDIDSLLYVVERKISNVNPFLEQTFITPYPNEYIALLCYIVKKNIDKIIDYSNSLINNNFYAYLKNKNLILFINRYFSLIKQNLDENKINSMLENEFNADDIKYCKTFILYLDFDKVKRIISNVNNKKSLIEKQQNPFSVEQNNELENIRLKLTEKYKNNTPNQINLSKVFDFV
ncbi:YcaO-like family protein [bacterium]|nr:YcaO-like family protein [bacterium]